MGSAFSHDRRISKNIFRQEDLWEIYQQSCHFSGDTLPALPEEIPPHHMRLVLMSDTHSLHGQIGRLLKFDVLLHAGDFTNIGEPKDVKSFNSFLEDFPHTEKFVIAGNHDLVFDEEQYAVLAMRYHQNRGGPFDPAAAKRLLTSCCYLENEAAHIGGYQLFGSPYTIDTGNFPPTWAFSYASRNDIISKFREIPKRTDILLTHSPPMGCLDTTIHGHLIGSYDLAWEVERCKPVLHLFGHCHECHGVMTNKHKTLFVNAACSSRGFEYVRPPYYIDLPLKNLHHE